jgi:hypothetical protein
MTITTGQLIYAAFVAASVTYQSKEASKARRRAREAADARKGLQLVTEGTLVSPPFAYGRVLVGGSRPYHNTSSNFKYSAPNSDKTFDVGVPDSGSFDYQELIYQNDNAEYVTVTAAPRDGTTLTRDYSGGKNEFLHFHQAICMGPINAVYDVIVDESMGLDDPQLGSHTAKQKFTSNEAASRPSFRVDCHYGETAKHDAISAANYPSRLNAKFPSLAWASAFVRLNRDDPAFNNVPVLQFLLEGRKVHTSENGELSPTRVYTNNPSWATLDYLMSEYGRGLPVSKIDLPSFERGAAVCDRVVMSQAVVGGNIWRPSDGSRNVQTRDIRLFECNVLLDTTKPIRENIGILLSTMGDARLVWNGSKYTLQLQVPQNEAEIIVSTNITDDSISMASDITKSWPEASERYNHATVRFNNEFLNFAEDSASWPPKETGVIKRGVGGDVYPFMDGWDDTQPYGELLNKHAVWSGQGTTSSMSWKFLVLTTGQQTLRFTADSTSSVTVSGGASATGTSTHKSVTTLTFSANKDDVISISASATGVVGLRGFAGEVVDSDGYTAWTSRSPAFTDFVTSVMDSTIYDTFVVEDGGMELEHDEFADGVTTPYHALAKAEEMVRTSRTRFKLSFTHVVTDKILQPGDIFEMNSETLNISNTFFKVDEAAVNEDGTVKIDAVRFDLAQLAWNVADDAFIQPKNPYSFTIPRPEWVTLTPVLGAIKDSAGMVNWAGVSDSRVVEYVIYVHRALDTDSNNYPVFEEVGRTTSNYFELPPLNYRSGMVAVRARTLTGMSEMTVSEPVSFSSRSISVSSDALGFVTDEFSVTNPSEITISVAHTGYLSPSFEWKWGDVVVGNSQTLVIQPFAAGGTRTFNVSVQELDPLLSEATRLTKTIQIFSLESGKAAIDIVMTNSSVVLPATFSGGVTSYSGASTTVRVMQGGINQTELWEITREDSTGVTSELDGDSSPSAFVNGFSQVEVSVVSMASGEDSGYVDIYATRNGVILSKRFSVTKSKSGTTSVSTYNAVVFTASMTAPATPTDGSYNFSTATLVAQTGWSAIPLSIENTPIWSSSSLFATENPLNTVQAAAWTAPTLHMLPPVKTQQVTVYKRSGSTPATPSETVSVNMDTGALSGLNNDWSTSIPVGADLLWSSVASAVNWAEFDSIAPNEWSSPIQISGTGATGFSSAVVLMFRRTTTNATPDVPIEDLVFTFDGASLSGNTNGWSQSIPNSGGGYIWMISATASSQSASDTILSSEWSAPSMVTTEGVPGTNAIQSTLVSVYQWSTVQPTAMPAGNATYNWSTTFTSMTTPNGWTDSVPTNPGTPGLRLWVLQKRISATATDVTTTFDFSGATLVYVSANGLAGPSGPQTTVAKVYAWGVTAPSIAGTSTYTWATANISPVPSGWSALPAGGIGTETLWEARVLLIDSPDATTSVVDWTGADILGVGYKASDTGTPGVQGNSAKRAYTITTASSLGAGPVTTIGLTSLPPSTSAFGSGLIWTSLATDPTPGTNEKLFQSDGIHNHVTDTTIWGRPYLSSLKVGNLSAVAVNTGALTVNDRLTMGNNGAIKTGNFNSFSWPTPDGIGGFYLSKEGLLIGNATQQQRIEINSEGDLISNQFSIINGNATFSGNMSAASGTLGQATLSPTGHIKGGQTSYDTGVGFFLGNHNGQTKFSLAGTNGAKFMFDGENIVLEKIQLISTTSADITGNSGSNSNVTNLSVSVSGGRPPYSFMWTSTMFKLSTPNGSSTNVTLGYAGENVTVSGYVSLLVVDANGVSLLRHVSVSLFSPAGSGSGA